jgi:hypothetical protein
MFPSGVVNTRLLACAVMGTTASHRTRRADRVGVTIDRTVRPASYAIVTTVTLPAGTVAVYHRGLAGAAAQATAVIH